MDLVTVERLSKIRAALLRELAGNDARLRFINMRLILTIGVDLNEAAPAEDADPGRVRLTMQTLHKMGFLKREPIEEEATRG
jgi:hypothetical protein